PRPDWDRRRDRARRAQSPRSRRKPGGSSRNPIPVLRKEAGSASRYLRPRPSGVLPLLGKKLVEDREDLRLIRNLAHGEIAVLLGDLAVGTPEIGGRRGEAVAQRRLGADLDIGEVLAQRYDLATEQLAAAIAVLGIVVAVRGLRRIDVPVIGAVAGAHDPHHLFERGRDDRATRLSAMEEGFFVHLLRIAGMADEDDVDLLVAPRQEDMQQQEEALGEILHRFGHRARHVHKAEHDRLRVWLWHPVKAVVADIDGVDEADAPGATLEMLEF